VKRLALLALLVSVPAGLAHADGCPPIDCTMAGSALPGSRVLAFRPHGQQGPLVAYDVVRARKRFTLPGGVLSANGRAYFALSNGVLTRYDARSGRALGTTVVGRNRLVAAASADGRFVALYWQQGQRSTFWVYDHTRLARTVELRGIYQPEALSPDARRLYLIHWYPRSSAYDLRVYDFARRTLARTRLADADEKMSGTAWSAIQSPNGHWLLTLYLKPDDTAFVHALDLRTGIAHCIDLPVAGSDFQTLGSYAFALSPDGKRLYLANAYLSNLYVVDLRTLRVVRTVDSFAEPSGPGAGNAGPTAAVSANGRMVYFSSGDRYLYSYDTAYGKVTRRRAVAKAVYGVPPSVGAVAVAPDGRRVVVVRSDRRVVTLPA
jgi:outer membrane protein assembly factor BamB